MTIKLFFGKTLFLATMLFTSIYAFAFTVDGINYTATSATEVKVDATPTASGSITIPSTVTDGGITYTVTSIGNQAFAYCSSLASVDFAQPSSITSIGNNAFDHCTGLTSITLPSSITSIGGGAFRNCTSLTSITLPSSITSIGNAAFVYCTGLTSITLPSSITSIGSNAFYGCDNLTSVTLPSSITSIGDYAFGDCISLASVTVNWQSPLDMSSSRHAFNRDESFGLIPKLYVPIGTVGAYQNALVWGSSSFNSIVESSSLATTNFNKQNDKVFFDDATNSLKLLTTSPKPFGEYEIYDATGRTILKGNANSGEISLNNISKGIYFLRAKNLSSTVKFRK